VREPVPALATSVRNAGLRPLPGAVANDARGTVRAENGSGIGLGATSPLEVLDFLGNLGHRLAAPRPPGSMLAVAVAAKLVGPQVRSRLIDPVMTKGKGREPREAAWTSARRLPAFRPLGTNRQASNRRGGPRRRNGQPRLLLPSAKSSNPRRKLPARVSGQAWHAPFELHRLDEVAPAGIATQGSRGRQSV